jgi:hypothetical protein
MKNKFLGVWLCSILFGSYVQAQGDLLDLLGTETEKTYATNAFKSPRVISGHSMEMLAAGALDFRILHRFGKITQGYRDLFGLDNATMRMSFDYGISKNLTVGLGRSTFKKELDGFAKYRIVQQSKGPKSFPMSILWVSGVTLNGLENPFSNPETKDNLVNRMAYFHQLILGRKFSDRFTLQLAPTWIHSNVVANPLIPNDLFAVELGARYKVSNRIAIVLDYNYTFNNYLNRVTTQPLSLGVDIETGGHVFQLHVSNATGMNERALMGEPNASWLDGDIQFGFNLSRVFQLRNRS